MDLNAIIEQFTNLQDLTSSFSMLDVTLWLTLSFILTSLIWLLYMKTHKWTSYTQSYVHTLVLMWMVITVIMLIVWSNIARAFSLVWALSIVRFRNAVKETKDVWFIFFAMAIGMAMWTKFYLLWIIATTVISLALLIMYKFNWYSRPVTSQILKIQVDNTKDFENLFDNVFVKYTIASDLVSVDSVRWWALTELVYTVNVNPKIKKQEFISELKKLNDNQKISLITWYDSSDL